MKLKITPNDLVAKMTLRYNYLEYPYVHEDYNCEMLRVDESSNELTWAMCRAFDMAWNKHLLN